MNTPKLTCEQIRAAGGIVHSDGNIFFTNIEKLNSAIAAIEAQGVQDGWQLVPKEPSDRMLNAASLATESEGMVTTPWLRKTVYFAMLASAPPAPQAEQNSIAYKEAARLATALFKQHFAHEERYASGQIVWGLFDTTAGVISQIDNMVSGLVHPLPAPQPLTREQVKGLCESAGYDLASPTEQADFINGIRHGEVAHGIKE